MPTYNIHMIVRSMPKQELVSVLKRNVEAMMGAGAMVTRLESGGHRDIPIAIRKAPNSDAHHFSANYFTVHAELPYKTWRGIAAEMSRDTDVLRHTLHKMERDPSALPRPAVCTLGEELRPAATRASVTALREMQSLNAFSRREAWRRARDQWRRIPKSATVAPHK